MDFGKQKLILLILSSHRALLPSDNFVSYELFLMVGNEKNFSWEVALSIDDVNSSIERVNMARGTRRDEKRVELERVQNEHVLNMAS